MKYCPNADCSYARKFKRPGEYRDEMTSCSDCGASLVETPPSLPSAPPAPVAVVKPSDANERLAVTVAAVLGWLLLAWLPIFGAPESIFGGDGTAPLNMLAVGMAPFVTAFVLVEVFALLLPVLRPLRVGGAKARAPLDRLGWGLGGLLLLAQLYGVTTITDLQIGPAGTDSVLPPAPLLWAQLVGAHLAMLGLALWVSRKGLGNGFGLLMAALLLPGFLEGSSTWTEGIAAEVFTLGALLVVALGVAVVTVRGVQLALAGRARGEALPMTAPFPISSTGAWAWAGALIAVPATLASWVPEVMTLARGLESSQALYTGILAFLAFDAALGLGFLFFRPKAVGALWAKWVPGVDETGVVAAARTLLPGALAASIGLTVGAPLALMLLGNMLNLPLDASSVLFVLVAACAVADVIDEWRALRRLGPLVSVWEVQRTAEVDPILHLLRTAGIEAHARSFLVRATQQFFAPWIPVSVLVPVGREGEARALLTSRMSA